MLLNLLKPVGYVRECLLIRAVVHQDDAHRALVVGLRYRPKALLPRSVPYLQLHSLLVNHDLLNLEINPYRFIVKFCLLTDRRHVAHWETVLRETQQQTRLAHARVPNDDQFKQVVVTLSARRTRLGPLLRWARLISSELRHLTNQTILF